MVKMAPEAYLHHPTCSEHMEILDDAYKLPNQYFAKLQSWKENIQGPQMKKKLGVLNLWSKLKNMAPVHL